jgi:hypothetical protein
MAGALDVRLVTHIVCPLRAWAQVWAMNTSDLWRSLATDFKSVPTVREFTAYRHYKSGNTQVNWQLTTDQAALVEFNVLARRGASMLTPPPNGDLSLAWLEALWHEATHGPVRSTSEVINPPPNFLKEGLRTPLQLRGKIDRVFEASSTLCKKLESAALQTEFEEKQQNDPRNWSQFRQQYEALKTIKDIINGPAERIPEEWVRSTIASIHGIKPEEVTPQQIRFEISGLLSSSRPRIELVPTATEEPPPPTTPEEITTDKPLPDSPPAQETIATQIQTLRLECKWTIEKLASKTGMDEKTVKRHLSGRSNPQMRKLLAYQNAFSKALKREVVINQMPPKRPPDAL